VRMGAKPRLLKMLGSGVMDWAKAKTPPRLNPVGAVRVRVIDAFAARPSVVNVSIPPVTVPPPLPAMGPAPKVGTVMVVVRQRWVRGW